jgi:hypothetical protein
MPPDPEDWRRKVNLKKLDSEMAKAELYFTENVGGRLVDWLYLRRALRHTGILNFSERISEKLIRRQREAHLFLDAAFTGDAESAMEAIRQKYLRQGYDEAWIKQRQITIETRNQLTDEWKNRGVRHKEYGMLTAVIHRGAYDRNPSDHKKYKGVEKGEVRDHMTGHPA